LDLTKKTLPRAGTFKSNGTGAKLLIEALSGRWSYDRREKRTVWYHVANAFSLLVNESAHAEQ